jgi:hypothetical protein
MSEKSWFDPEYVAERKAAYEAKVAKNEAASKAVQKFKEQVKNVFQFKKVQVA